MKMKRIALAAAFTALCLCGCSSSDAKKERTEITVLAAASLTESCEDIEKMYEAEHSGTDLVFSFGGSGALQIQIEEGAPADIFLSAGKKQMDALVDEKLVDSSSVNDLLENKVVLIVPEGSKAEIRALRTSFPIRWASSLSASLHPCLLDSIPRRYSVTTEYLMK